jgi:hypothetical protein
MRPRNSDWTQPFGDYVNKHWASGLGMHNQTQVRTAERFLAFLFQELSSECTADYRNRARDRWIKEAAYFRWLNGGQQDGTHFVDWFASVHEYDALETTMGCRLIDTRG